MVDLKIADANYFTIAYFYVRIFRNIDVLSFRLCLSSKIESQRENNLDNFEREE